MKRKMLLFAALLTLVVFAISANSIPPLTTTLANQTDTAYVQFGYIFLLQYICFAAASVIGGWATQKGWSCFDLVVTGLLGVAVMFGIGAFLSRFIWFMIWILPLGFFGGLIETFATIIIAGNEKNNSSKLLNLSQIFYCLGAIFAPQIIAMMLGYGISWRIIFVVLSLIILLIGSFFILMSRKHRAALNEKPAEKADLPEGDVSVPLFRDALLYLLAFILFLYVFIEMSVASWISVYFEKRFELPVSSAAWRLCFYWVGVITGRFVMLALPRSWTLWPALIFAGLGMIAGYVCVAFATTAVTATAAVVLAGIAAGPIWPIVVTISQRVRNCAKFTSAVIAAGSIGAALGPLCTSWIIEYLGLNTFFPLLSIGSIILFVPILFSKKLAYPFLLKIREVQDEIN